jgi:hypothetical protein
MVSHMIVLPEEFEPTFYDGYFWNTANKKLYSIKVDGVLIPLKRKEAKEWFWKYPKVFPGDWYEVSVRGKRKIYPVVNLEQIKPTGDRVFYEIKVREKR